MTRKTITLTPYQARLLDDRPEDCICESIQAEHGWFEELDANVEHVKACIRSRRIDLAEFTPIQEEILADCLTGSTWCGQLAAWVTPGERLAYANAVRSVRTLTEKFRAAGIPIAFVPDA